MGLTSDAAGSIGGAGQGGRYRAQVVREALPFHTTALGAAANISGNAADGLPLRVDAASVLHPSIGNGETRSPEANAAILKEYLYKNVVSRGLRLCLAVE